MAEGEHKVNIECLVLTQMGLSIALDSRSAIDVPLNERHRRTTVEVYTAYDYNYDVLSKY